MMLCLAFALATACSQEFFLMDEAPKTVHITVGANMGEPQTRSAVVTEDGTRTLTFTTGDRLYVWGYIPGTAYRYIGCYLDLVGTPESGATSASFEGDLVVYEYSGAPSYTVKIVSHSFSTADPLSECTGVYGVLVHKDAVGFQVNYGDRKGYYMTDRVASSVENLMTQIMEVRGSYNSGTKSFPLSVDLWGYSSDEWCAPIFNCTISGLKPSTTYNVSHIYEATFEDALDEHGNYLGTITSDAEGNATFACYNVCVKAAKYHVLKFLTEDYTDDRNVYLGSKALADKVYNITRPALKFQEAAFSVGTQQVYFSKGNLYARKDSDWKWYFQPHQWMYVGDAAGNKLITGPMTISQNSKKVDLFGWNGASSPNDCYGINNSATDTDYGTGDGEALKHDWGHNVIGSYVADTWRTPTGGEWDYLINDRTVTNSLSAGARYTFATLGGTYKGLILFPDNYTHPDGTGFTAGTFNAASNYTATVSMEGWMLMENAGCVFLPAAGSREGTTVSVVETNGYYSSATAAPNGSLAQSFWFGYVDLEHNGIEAYVYDSRHYGSSVRLVRDVE